MKKFKRIFVIVADSLGIGSAKDSVKYGDEGANTFAHIADGLPGFFVPTLEELGIGNICNNKTVLPQQKPKSVVCRLEEASIGKDTLTGHFEMMGLKVIEPYPSFTDTGFPEALIKKIEEYSKRKVIGNCAASGTEIIKELGMEQIQNGSLIVYTSSDSVLQIAANEEIIPLNELYDICSYVRKITAENPKWKVGRIIARPFVGNSPENFKRTTNRHDYALKPFAKTVLDFLKDKGFDTIAVGKINDIFDGEGISEFVRTVSNHDGMVKTTEYLRKDFTGLCFTNLVDFDALYGHRRDLEGYGRAIMEFDEDLKEFISNMSDDDLLMVTADHGNDPTWTGTDHTRENTPLICYYRGIEGKVLENQASFATIGCTITDNFKTQAPIIGSSILSKITRNEIERFERIIPYKNHNIISYVWKTTKSNPLGTVQIFHGMAEHILRYEEFIFQLVQNGYNVIGHDHLAHGRSCDVSKIGIIEDGDFMEQLLEVCKLVRESYSEFFTGNNYLFAHSMGAMAATKYIEIYPEDFNKLVLSGCDLDTGLYRFSKSVFKHLIHKYGKISYPKALYNLTTKRFNRKFKKDHPEFGWLSKNKNNVLAYESCEMCGNPFPTNYYYSLADMLVSSGLPDNLYKINSNLKILIVSGEDDPISNYSKSTIKLYKRYTKLGLETHYIIYKNVRHEILNEDEKTKKEVTKDIINFFND